MDRPVPAMQGPSSKLDRSSVLPPVFPVISTPLSVLAALPAGEWSLLQDDWAPGLGCGFCGENEGRGQHPTRFPQLPELRDSVTAGAEGRLTGVVRVEQVRDGAK